MQNASAALAVAAAMHITAAPITVPDLAAGEVWGGIACVAGKLHHVIILPGDNDEAEWEKQVEWAKSIGGEPPTSIEQKVLFANAKDQFKPEWYWSGEPHASYESYAWMQIFSYGNQLCSHKGDVYRARAVRRVPIQ